MIRSMIATEDDLTPQTVRALRQSLGLSQPEFWAAAHASKGIGMRTEAGEAVGKPYRRLIFLQHVIGLNVDCTDPENVATLRALAALQGDTAALLRAGTTRAQLERARDKINEAIQAIEGISSS